MMQHIHARRLAGGVLALGVFILGGCDSLLEPQQPGVISPETIQSAGATGAQALYVGAIGRFQNWTGGGGGGNSQNVWIYSDLLTDVWKTSDTFTQRINMDRRAVDNNDAEVSGVYSSATQSRGFYRDALRSLREFRPNEPWKQAEMYFFLGFTEMNMGEVFCNGIPFGETVNGVVTYTDPISNQETFALALTHLDSAITLASGTDAASLRIRRAAMVAKGRTLVNMARFADAVTAIGGVTGVPTSFQYILTFSQTTQSNAIWSSNINTVRHVVGDSVSLVNGTPQLIRNAIPFGSANDPRVPVDGAYNVNTRTGFDGSTPFVGQKIWGREDPIVIVSGIDARLIEAEARLQVDDYAGMMTILNKLRTDGQLLGNFAVPTMTALAVPTTKAAAIDIFFREKAFWQFARGTRLGDLRRLMRQYGRAEADVFPEGGFHKTPFTFGDDVNLPVTDNEKTNPKFQGCTDRLP
jgi:starch-binding outer membrane protein, SusD/RagB family